MKVPDKLYINKNIYDNFIYQVPNPDDKTEVEYIRADTFIEKAVKYVANRFLAPGMDNEINDFVNYMKG
jgi:hypothetical protein